MVGNRHRSWCFQSSLSAALILRRVPPVPPTRSQTRHSISLKCTIFHTRPGTRHHIPEHCTTLHLFGPHIESLHHPTSLTQPTEVRLVSPVNNWKCLERHAQGIPQYQMLENWKPVLGQLLPPGDATQCFVTSFYSVPWLLLAWFPILPSLQHTHRQSLLNSLLVGKTNSKI